MTRDEIGERRWGGGAVLRVAVGLATLSLLLVLAPGRLSAQESQDPALRQSIEADQPVAEGRVVLDIGHVDIGPRYDDEEWTLMVHDDSVEPSVWRRLDDVVFRVGNGARAPAPDDPAYEFLGAPAGSEVFVLPQVQDPEVVWLGWNTQDPAVTTSINRGATQTLLGVNGPGNLTVYLQSGDLSGPEPLWDSSRAEPQPMFVSVNTHTHANWVFTEAGVYLLRVAIEADLVTGESVRDEQILRFAVGGATPANAAFAAEYVAPRGDERTGTTVDASSDAVTTRDDAEAAGSASPLFAIVGGATLLAAVVAAFALRGSSAKRRVGRTRESNGPTRRTDSS